MKILVFSDVHDLSGYSAAYKMIDVEKPDVALCAGDWGSNLPTQKLHVLAKYSPEFLKLSPLQYEDLFKPILEKTHFHTIMGNHDVPDVLEHLRNRDGSFCLLESFKKVSLDGLSLVGINGNVSGRGNPWNVTLTELRHQYAKHRPSRPDIVLSHEAIAPYQPKGRPELQEFLDLLRPRFWFNGHVHQASDVTVDHYDREKDKVTGTTRLVGLKMMLHGFYATLDTESGKLETNKEMHMK